MIRGLRDREGSLSLFLVGERRPLVAADRMGLGEVQSRSVWLPGLICSPEGPKTEDAAGRSHARTRQERVLKRGAEPYAIVFVLKLGGCHMTVVMAKPDEVLHTLGGNVISDLARGEGSLCRLRSARGQVRIPHNPGGVA